MTRFEFSKTQKREMAARSGGICEAGNEGTHAFYGMELGTTCQSPAREFDHVIPDGLKREKPRSADEGLHVCLVHHKNKTHGRDRPMIQKAKDLREKAQGITAPKAHIQSRGFSPRFKPTDKVSRIASNHAAHLAAMNRKAGVA